MLLALAGWLTATCATAADLVIVIDDLGYNLPRGEQVLALPGPVTLSLLPFAPETATLAARARQTGHEILLHQPMEPLPAAHARLEPGTLTVGMSAGHMEAEMDAALGAVPGAIGINNHTGSRLTQDPAAMRQLMHYLAARELLFLDSRTTAATVAYRIAREASVPALQRDVFLDHELSDAAMAGQFERALEKARSQGYAVVIAHPHAESIAFLDDVLRRLPADTGLISLAELSARLRPALLVRHESPAPPHRSLGQ